jgi:PAS domain S-box-containing protein
MDWEDQVTHLTNAERPALIVDGVCRIQFVNAAMEKLLGWRLDDLSERRWLATCVAAGERSRVRDAVAAGLRGDATQAELALVTRAGRRIVMQAELSRETNGRARVLVLVARDVHDSAPPVPPTGDCWCDVSRAPGEMGRITAVRFLDPMRDVKPFVGQAFGVLLEDLGARAAERWVLDVLEGRTPYVADVVLPKADDAFRVVTALAVDDDTVRVAVRCVEARLLPELVDAKAARVAETSGLSERERQVLTLLLRGRGVEDIATMLEIAPRTVKFHQANVLQKLGADSRLDLLRVVL